MCGIAGIIKYNRNPEKKKVEHISFTSPRRFGLELELNAFDGKNRPDGGQPAGKKRSRNYP